MKIEILTTITTYGGPSNKPVQMKFESKGGYGDNPKFWGDSVQDALVKAHKEMAENIAPQIQYRQG